MALEPRGRKDLATALAGARPKTVGQELEEFGQTLLTTGKSALTAASTELVGIEAPRDVQELREDHPVLGLGSELLGFAAPYGLYAKALGRSTKATKALDAIAPAAKAAERPFRTGFAREVARFTPFEAARLGTTALVGDEGSFSDIAFESAVNLAAFGTISGAVKAFRASRGAPGTITQAEDRLSKSLTDFRLSDPPQIKARVLQHSLTEELPARFKQDIGATLQELRRVVRQEIPAGNKYVPNLEGASKEQLRGVNRLFQPSGAKAKTIAKRRFVSSSRASDFESVPKWKEAASKFGLQEGFEDYMQFPRLIQPLTGGTARGVRKSLEGLADVGQGWRMGREANNGMFVMAKVLGDPAMKAAKNTDEILLFKTDQPGLFSRGAQRWSEAHVRREAWMAGAPSKVEVEAATKSDLINASNDFMERLPFQDYAVKSRQTTVGKALEKLGVKRTDVGAEAERIRKAAKEFFSPTLFQFSENPRARWILGVAKYVFERADATAEKMLAGERNLANIDNLFKASVQLKPSVGGLRRNIGQLTPEDMTWVQLASLERLTPEAMVQAGATERSVKFIRKLQQLDAESVAQIEALQNVTGERGFRALSEHYMISRTWKGPFRVKVTNEAGDLIYIASGKKPAAALKEADEIIAAGSAEGQALSRDAETFLSSAETDLEIAQKIAFGDPAHTMARKVVAGTVRKASQPGFFEERKGVQGFITDFTRKDLEDILRSHIVRTQKYMADSTARHQLGPALMQLAQEDPGIYRQLVQRLDDMAGRQTQFSKTQNQVADKLLAPYLGTNSAQKIARTMNSVEMNLRLGFFNLGFPVINALTFMQTVLPHASFVMSAAPESVARYYTWFPVAGQGGKVLGQQGSMDMFKLMKGSFGEMAKPGAELKQSFKRAAQEGVTDPRLVEEWVGETAVRIREFKKTVNDEGFVPWIRAVSEFLPGASEKLARAHAFTTGNLMGRDFLRLQGEPLYQFAKEFTSNTMFLYNTADRARVLTGPVGSVFGMFKNWQMHYMGQMLQYAGEATRGNFNPLLWMLAGTGATAGVGGLPLFGAADMMSRMFSDKGLMENIYGGFGLGDPDDPWQERASDGLFYGIPGFFGLSLQASTGAPGADIARDASMLTSFAIMDRMGFLGQAAGSAYDQWAATGDHPVKSMKAQGQLVRALAPKIFYRWMMATEDGALRSLGTGNKLTGDIGFFQRQFFRFGLTPTDIDRFYAVSSEMWSDQNQLRSKTRQFGQAFLEAQQRRSSGDMTEILRRAMGEGLDITSVMKSAATRKAKQETDLVDRQFDSGLRQNYRAALPK